MYGVHCTVQELFVFEQYRIIESTTSIIILFSQGKLAKRHLVRHLIYHTFKQRLKYFSCESKKKKNNQKTRKKKKKTINQGTQESVRSGSRWLCNFVISVMFEWRLQAAKEVGVHFSKCNIDRPVADYVKLISSAMYRRKKVNFQKENAITRRMKHVAPTQYVMYYLIGK